MRTNGLSPFLPRRRFANRLRGFACALLAVLGTIPLAVSRFSAQDLPATVGQIEGDNVVVTTAIRGGMETNAAPTIVASGSEVMVRSGGALLLLQSGGEISICGPAHFTVLKSAGAVTLALDYGRVHPSLESSEPLTIYTPTVVATPVAISGGPRDMTLALDQNGEMCIVTAHGAMRVEPQFSGQSMVVPQGGVVNLANGQMASLGDASSCSCEFERPGAEHARGLPSASGEISAIAHPVQSEQNKPDSSAPMPAQQPVYKVLMPPLSFDASSPEPPPDPSPETILLVREIRVRPSAVFYGHVNPAPAPAVAPALPASPPPPQVGSAGDGRAAQTQPGMLTRARNWFRKLLGP